MPFISLAPLTAEDLERRVDSRGPWRYLTSVFFAQGWRSWSSTLVGIAFMCTIALQPMILAAALDEGVAARDGGKLAFWCVVLIAFGIFIALLGMVRHRMMSTVRLGAELTTVLVLTRRATQLGAALSRRIASGEVVSVASTDANYIASALMIAGPGVGGFVSIFFVVGLLWSVHWSLGVIALAWIPIITAIVVPLMRLQQQRFTHYRKLQSGLTGRAADVVSGLRVLSGIGGKRTFARHYHDESAKVREAGYRFGSVVTWTDGLINGAPALLVAAITWAAGRQVVQGNISIGDFVAAYGYTSILIFPTWFLIQGSAQLATGLVSARRIAAVLNLQRDLVDTADPVPGPAVGSDFVDATTATTIPGGRFTVIAAATPAAGSALLERLARIGADSAALTRWGDVDIASVALAEMRRRVLLADNDAYLFPGPLRAVLGDTAEPERQARIRAAIDTASASDIIEALPRGLDTETQTQGRNFSGGQRQRIRMVRALVADPEVLFMIEPTSAVDANTESVIAERLVADRVGRTTAVATTSPHLLHRADTVIFLPDSGAATIGTHQELLASTPAYRSLVTRSEGEVGAHV